MIIPRVAVKIFRVNLLQNELSILDPLFNSEEATQASQICFLYIILKISTG